MLEKLKALIAGRRQAYVNTFDNVHGRKVLGDLAVFCRADKSTFHPDSRVHAVLEGRREVWLRIANHLNLSPEQLYELFQEGKNPGS
jgi:hypothetical protein